MQRYHNYNTLAHPTLLNYPKRLSRNSAKCYCVLEAMQNTPTLERLDFPFDYAEFSFKEYSYGEQKIFNPQLEKAGYKLSNWFSEDFDSFGPLVRAMKVSKNGIDYIVSYG